MAYVGTPIDTTNQFQSLQGKRFSGDGSTTAFTLDIAPSSVFDIEVFVENVRQDPNSAYGISGTTLTFTGAPPSGTNNIYVVHQAKAVGTIDVPASSVVPASLASNIISGQTALGATPADTDEFLVSDAGTIKRVDYSYIKASNTPNFFANKTNDQTISSGTSTKAEFDTEEFDSDSAFASNRFTVPSGQAGKYFFYTVCHFTGASDQNYHIVEFFKNGSVAARSVNRFAGTNSLSESLSLIFDLSAGDYMEVYVKQNSGSDKTLRGEASERKTYFLGFKLA